MVKSKKIFYAFICFITYISSFFCYAESEDIYTITDREFLLLSIISYSNDIEKDVAQMLESKISSFGVESLVVSEDLEEWEIVDHQINDNSSKSGFSVFTFKKKNNIVIVPRGTDGGVFSENYKYFLGPKSEHPQAKYMKEYTENLVNSLSISDDTKIFLAGHSLGGYLALYGAGIILNIDKAKDHFEKVVTFNGLGLGHYTNPQILNILKSTDKNKIVNYRIIGDVVSCIGLHITDFISFSAINFIPKNTTSVWYKILPGSICHQIIQFIFHKKFWSQWQIEAAANRGKNILDIPVKTPEFVKVKPNKKTESTVDVDPTVPIKTVSPVELVETTA